MIACCLFDLDGVIVDTARYHYLAWASLARELGPKGIRVNAAAPTGVSRLASLDIVRHAGGRDDRFSPAEKERLAAEKNARYLAYVSAMTPAEVLPGAAAFLRDVRAHGVLTVLGSASKNAGTILDRCGLRPLFDAVVDGTGVTHPKPDPEVFAKGAGAVGARPENCVVFEDAAAGIEAAARAGMRSVGVGGSPLLAGASMQLKGFEGFTFEMLCREID